MVPERAGDNVVPRAGQPPETVNRIEAIPCHIRERRNDKYQEEFSHLLIASSLLKFDFVTAKEAAA